MNQLAEAPESRTSIHIGGVFASRESALVHTVLGSCVATCLFDPEAGIGGMNHFMLPDGNGDGHLPSRFGVHAMELLINRIMKLGGDRRRLRAKVFGGADLLGFGELKVGAGNAAFAFSFLQTESIPVVAARLGGWQAISVDFHTGTARTLVRPLSSSTVSGLLRREEHYRKRLARLANRERPNEIRLF